MQLIVIIVAGGVYLTATTVDDPLWWQVSFSYLGKMESNAKMLFNVTFIFTGILLLTWMGYFMSDFQYSGAPRCHVQEICSLGSLWFRMAGNRHYVGRHL